MTLAERGGQNLLDTYRRIALACPGASLEQRERYELCLADLPHPVANFAARLNLDPWAARELQGVASNREAFHVYEVPGDRPDHLREVLERNGFRHHYELCQLAAEGADNPDLTLELASEGTRLLAARFMVEQFFTRQASPLRRKVAEATARAEGLEMLVSRHGGRIRAAALVNRRDGVLGLYNLCVSSAHRGRGIGSAFVRSVRKLAQEGGQTVVLQCDPRLAGWYRELGFQDAGRVHVYTLAKTLPNAIMDVV